METEPTITICYAFHLVILNPQLDFKHREVASISYRSYTVAWEDFSLLGLLDFRG